MARRPPQVIENEAMRDARGVFADRADAGRALAQLLRGRLEGDCIVLAIPAGGVPVATVIAAELKLPLDLAVASKIQRPGNPEAGYGAVAFDGTVLLDHDFIERAGLDAQRVEQDIAATRERVEERIATMRGDRHLPRLQGRTAILVDDGLASGSTMLAAIKAVRHQQPARIVVVVPTAHSRSIERVLAEVDEVVCANIRDEPRFAVADAYRQWRDVDDAEAIELLRQYAHERSAG